MSAEANKLNPTEASTKQSHTGVSTEAVLQETFEQAKIQQQAPDREGAIQRSVTFWHNGFSFDDGELRLYNDPKQTELLVKLNAGTAPPEVFGAPEGQLVELKVYKRLDEDYAPAKQPQTFPPPPVRKPESSQRTDANDSQSARAKFNLNLKNMLRSAGF